MAFEIKKISQLERRLQSIFERAKNAIMQHNYQYAFEMLRSLLREQPGCNEARKVLRAAQLEYFGEHVSPLMKSLAAVKTCLPIFITGPIKLGSGKVVEALDMAEKAMDADPTNVSACHFLFSCAKKAELAEVATDALELCLRYSPNDLSTLEKIINHYQQIGEVHKAITHMRHLCTLQPNNMALENEMKQLSARAALEKGWGEAESFRDVMKDKKQAEALEQAERATVRDVSTLDGMIEEAEETAEAKPTIANLKRLAGLYGQKKDFDKALETYDKIVEVMGALDPTIDEAITKVLMAQYDDAIAQWRSYAEEDADKAAEAEQQIAEIEQQREETTYERSIDRVKRYPNDPNYRYELGEVHFKRGEYDDAMNQFQYAQRNPQIKRKSLTFLGRCLAKKGLPDLAVDTLTSALGDITHIDTESKDILYHLAVVQAETGSDEDALKSLKRIYAVDVNYKDVSKRIEEYYAQGRK